MAQNMSQAMASNMQKAALVVGAVFGVVGILGFIPGITTDYDTMEFWGPDSEAMLLGIFQVSIFHNLVHLLFAIAGFAMARTFMAARAFLIGGGAIYLVLWIYGLFVDEASTANFVPLNTADDWLHLGLGVVMILLGLVLSSRTTTSPTRRA